METINKKDNQITFKVEISESLANAIRRYLSQIPVLAVDEVEISKNDSPLYDETVAHRIGLIPLKTDKGIKKDSEVKLKLISNKEGMVYSGEISGGTDVVYDKIPITSLEKDQGLELSAVARIGKGSEHSKFVPGLMFYRDEAKIALDKGFAEEVKKLCSKNDISEKDNKIVVLDNKPEGVGDLCEGIAERSGKKAEFGKTGNLIITLESFGQMSVENIFSGSVEALKKDLADVSKNIK